MAGELPDLQLAWSDACKEFVAATQIQLSDDAPPIQQIVAGLEKLQVAEDRKSRTTMGKAREAVTNTLCVVQTIGGILAQTAQISSFGGPASIAMNCISYFIQTGIAYNEIIDSIHDLFHRMVPILERAQVYIQHKSSIGPEMTIIASRLLLAVVKICQHCITELKRRKSKREKVKLFLTVAFFDEDSGVQEQRDILQSLQEQEMHMSHAVTVVTTKNIERDVGAIKADLDMNEIAKSEDRILNDLITQLGVENLVDAMHSEYVARKDRLRSWSCTWLEEDTEYSSWADTSRHSSPLMLLRGGEGCGKSYVMAAVIRDLLHRYPQCQGDSTRVSVAYFYFKATITSPARGGKRSVPSIKDMLRTLAGQAINNDAFYRKTLHKKLNFLSDLRSLQQFLHELFLEHLPRGSSFFLLIDDTQELDDDEKEELCNLIDAFKTFNTELKSIRVMIAARESLCESLLSHARAHITTIMLKVKTEPDMVRFVTARANKLDVFQRKTKEIEELKKDVIEKLPAAVEGNFVLAERKLEEIDQCDEAEDVRQVISSMRKEGTGLSDTVKKDILRHNQILNTKELRTLNALLLWVMYTEWELQIHELESILYIQEQRTSLQPLHREIQEKYAVFFNVSDEKRRRDRTVTLKHSAEYFKSIEYDLNNDGSDPPVSNREIQMVRHFIEKLCEREIYDRLGFADFFDQRLAKSEVRIMVDHDNAHARIALCCLQVLAGDQRAEVTGLEKYANVHLWKHIKHMELDSVNTGLKVDIGRLIVKVFTDQDLIIRCNKYTWQYWSYKVKTIEQIVNMLQSPVVRKKISTANKAEDEWLDNVLSSRTPGIELLSTAARVITNQWLKAEVQSELMIAFRWLYGYYNKIESVDAPWERLYRPPEGKDIHLKTIQRIYELTVARGLPPDVRTSLRCFGMTLLSCEHYSEAVKRLEEHLSDHADDFIAQNALANAYAKLASQSMDASTWGKALESLNVVLEYLKTGKRLTKGHGSEKTWRELTSTKAKWLAMLGRHEESLQNFEDLLEKSPDDVYVRRDFVQSLCQAGKHSRVVDLLQGMTTEVDLTTKQPVSTRFLHSHAGNDLCHMYIIGAFRQAERLADAQNHYRQALQHDWDGNDWQKKYVRNQMTFYLGTTLYITGPGSPERDEAIQLWEEVIDRCRRDRKHKVSQVFCAKQLAKAYLNQAVRAGKGTPLAADMLIRIRRFHSDEDDDVKEHGLSQVQFRALLARYYYKVLGDFEKAQDTLRPDMELALQLLSDDDDDNDWQGWTKLGDALMDSGSTEDARAAWTLIQPRIVPLDQTLPAASPADSSSEGRTDDPPATNGKKSTDSNDNSASAQTETAQGKNTFITKPLGPLTYVCDGRCGTRWTYADNFYICQECIDVQFDKSCLDKLRKGKLTRIICDPSHTFLHVPEWTKESAERARDRKVLVDGAERDVDEWISEIKKKWHFGDNADVTSTAAKTINTSA